MSALVFVDTSVWIDALRGRPRTTGARLRVLLDEDRVGLAVPVRLEILSGASQHDFHRLSQDLSALPAFYPSRSTWRRMEGWLEVAGRYGERFAVADLLIAAIASEQNGKLWSRDHDFVRLSNLGFVELFDP
ncbi:MAG: PIN domain-containing protein [Acidobacteriota bacterium]